MTGTIKVIKRDKGYGFIKTEDRTDYFFHMSVLEGITFDELQEGMKVEFEGKLNDQGKTRADSVKVI